MTEWVLTLVCVAQVAPGIYPLLVERIIVARPDLLKADVREVSFFCHAHVPHVLPVQNCNDLRGPIYCFQPLQ